MQYKYMTILDVMMPAQTVSNNFHSYSDNWTQFNTFNYTLTLDHQENG